MRPGPKKRDCKYHLLSPNSGLDYCLHCLKGAFWKRDSQAKHQQFQTPAVHQLDRAAAGSPTNTLNTTTGLSAVMLLLLYSKRAADELFK